MPVMRWAGGRVDVEDSVAMPRGVTGKALRDGFLRDIAALTVGLIRASDNSLYLGPIELLRFGFATVAPTRVDWPIEGGMAVRAPGGHLTIQTAGGRLVSSVQGYQPRLPLPLYTLTQLPIHHLVTRLHLLRVRGRQPAPGVPVEPAMRVAAAAIDVALCAALAAASPRGRRLPALIGITACYHVACWSLSGRTLGGLAMKQRVVAVDGSKPSAGQAVVRLAALPLSVLRLRAMHDEVAGTDVVSD
jgi:hypothetical protein